MKTLQAMRNCRTTVRWMLVWFCMAMGVAVASPMVHPQALTLVCTAAGAMKMVATTDADEPAPVAAAHTLDCVLCLTAGAPPVADIKLPTQDKLTQVYRPVYLALPLWRTTAPTSARDPPQAT
jgi:hypothetical protein